jgi:hypothetical protein
MSTPSTHRPSAALCLIARRQQSPFLELRKSALVEPESLHQTAQAMNLGTLCRAAIKGLVAAPDKHIKS